MSKRFLSVLSLVFVSAFMVFGTSPANAAVPVNGVTITHYGTDAMGADTFFNRNREFVEFKNNSGSAQDLNGLKVVDNWRWANMASPSVCNKYTVGATLPGQPDSMLAIGDSVRVLNGFGINHKVGTVFYLYAKSPNFCGAHGHFYSNDADTIRLVSGATVVNSISWDWHGGYSFTV